MLERLTLNLYGNRLSDDAIVDLTTALPPSTSSLALDIGQNAAVQRIRLRAMVCLCPTFPQTTLRHPSYRSASGR